MPLDRQQLAELSRQQKAGEPLRLVPPAKKRKRDNREHRIQKSICDWWHHACAGFGVDERLLYAVPNGALLGIGMERVIRAKNLKAEGLRPGWPDLGVDVARHGYPGLRIEVKVPGEDAKPHQEAIHRLLRAQGYRVEIVRSVEEGIAVITDYLR